LSNLKEKMQEQLARATQKVRDEAYEAGYLAALRDMDDLSSSRPAQLAASATQTTRARRSPDADYKPPITRGLNANIVGDALKSIAPRAAGPTEIIALVKKATGTKLAYSSTKHAINQLLARGECEQTGNLKLWKYRSPNANVVGLKR